MTRGFTCGLVLILALASALPGGAARANGGGTASVYLGGGAGAFRPKKQSDVRLLSEELVISLTGRRNRLDRAERESAAELGHTVRARYRLSNKGPSRAALYGVPIVVPAVPDPMGPETARAATEGSAVADTIRISVGGKEHRCTYYPEPALPPGVVPTDFSTIGANVGDLGIAVAGFCVAELTLPSGDFELTLSYSAPLFALDETPPSAKECAASFSPAELARCEEQGAEEDERCASTLRQRDFLASEKCNPRTERSGYFLYYPFGAAATWAGTPSRISVTVKLGGFQVDRKASRGVPPDAVEASGALRWTWKSPSLEGLDVVLSLSTPGAENGELRAFNGFGGSEATMCRLDAIEAEASSFLAPIGDRCYEPEKALDGVGSTAWCVRTKTGGRGEWIELRFASPGEAGGRVSPHGLYLLPGLGGSQKLYEANGRVRRVRYGPCGPATKRVEAEVPVKDEVLESVVQVPGSEKVIGELLSATKAGEQACLRVEIAEVLPGTKSADVCISELSLPMQCR